MNTQKQNRGFTIIEVVLVLAIAALIFLMIFIALPALQRGQRDTARKQDASTVATAINTWKGNHRGSLPDEAEVNADIRTDYVAQLGQYDTDDEDLFIVTEDESMPAIAGEDANGLERIGVALGAQCDDDGSAVEAGTNRTAAVVVLLEASNATVCIDV